MVVFACPLEFEGMSLLLKIFQNLDIGLETIELEWTRKPPPLGLAPKVLERAMQGGKKTIQKSYSAVILICIMTSTARYPILVLTNSLVQQQLDFWPA